MVIAYNNACIVHAISSVTILSVSYVFAKEYLHCKIHVLRKFHVLALIS